MLPLFVTVISMWFRGRLTSWTPTVVLEPLQTTRFSGALGSDFEPEAEEEESEPVLALVPAPEFLARAWAALPAEPEPPSDVPACAVSVLFSLLPLPSLPSVSSVLFLPWSAASPVGFAAAVRAGFEAPSSCTPVPLWHAVRERAASAADAVASTEVRKARMADSLAEWVS